jgi:hypothetical protein
MSCCFITMAGFLSELFEAIGSVSNSLISFARSAQSGWVPRPRAGFSTLYGRACRNVFREFEDSATLSDSAPDKFTELA